MRDLAGGQCGSRRLRGVRGYVSKVPNVPGAVAVRVLWKQGRRQVGMRHVRTGRSDAEVALLEAAAWEIINAGQDPFSGVAEDGSRASAGGAVAVGGPLGFDHLVVHPRWRNLTGLCIERLAVLVDEHQARVLRSVARCERRA